MDVRMAEPMVLVWGFFNDVVKARLGLLETDWSISLASLSSLHRSAACETLPEGVLGRTGSCLESRSVAFVFRPNYCHKLASLLPLYRIDLFCFALVTIR